MHVTHDAHDFGEDAIGAPGDLEPVAQRIGVAPDLFGEVLAHDGDHPSIGRVGGVEGAAAQHRDLERVEQAAVGDADVRGRRGARLRHRLVGVVERGAALHRCERQAVGEAHRLHPRNRPRAVGQLGEERVDALARIFAAGQAHLRHHDLARLESRIDAEEPGERTDQEPGAGQQQQRHRDLQHHQARRGAGCRRATSWCVPPAPSGPGRSPCPACRARAAVRRGAPRRW